MSKSTTSKTRSHLFQPGVSGNPGGRPKSDATIRELAKQHTEEALLILVEIAMNKKSPPSARVHAACALLDRGWGKPSMYFESMHSILTYADYLDTLPPPLEDDLCLEVESVHNSNILADLAVSAKLKFDNLDSV